VCGTTLAVTSVVPSSPILVTLMMEALRSSETPVLTRVTRRNTSEDGVLHSHRRENLKSYKHAIACDASITLFRDPTEIDDIKVLLNNEKRFGTRKECVLQWPSIRGLETSVGSKNFGQMFSNVQYGIQ
jgi:hypothetical protein